MTVKTIQKTGLGLRKAFIDEVLNTLPKDIHFFEIHPENYMQRGGYLLEQFQEIQKHYPVVCHGLSLNIASSNNLDFDFLKQLKKFLHQNQIPWFSDHLCFTYSGNAHLHDLMPVPFTKEVVNLVSEKAKIVQDFLEIPFGLENVSYYFQPSEHEMTEKEFLHQILQKSGVKILLDINNAFVNEFNHGDSAWDLISSFSENQILQIHMAGHKYETPNLIVDTHGESITQSVWDLLKKLSGHIKLPPVLIERDNNIPDLSELLKEVKTANTLFETAL